VPIMGRLVGEALISQSKAGRLFTGSWTCSNTTGMSGSPGAGINQQARADFESFVEKSVNASKYSAVKDKVRFYLIVIDI